MILSAAKRLVAERNGKYMMNLKGTKTEKNLLEAFTDMRIASKKYEAFVSEARKEGFEHVAALFENAAGNEEEYAKIYYNFLCNGESLADSENIESVDEDEKESLIKLYRLMAADISEADISKTFSLKD